MVKKMHGANDLFLRPYISRLALGGNGLFFLPIQSTDTLLGCCRYPKQFILGNGMIILPIQNILSLGFIFKYEASGMKSLVSLSMCTCPGG